LIVTVRRFALLHEHTPGTISPEAAAKATNQHDCPKQAMNRHQAGEHDGDLSEEKRTHRGTSQRPAEGSKALAELTGEPALA